MDFGDPATETQAGITVLSVNSDVVSIQNFAIKNLNREASGGGMLVAGNVALFMEKVEILNNRATRGGGIEVNGSLGPIINMRHTLISGNAATTGSGGGIYAAGGPGLIIMDGDSALANNRANFHGGGAHISGGNLLAFASGNPNSYNSNKTAATAFENGVYGNKALHFQNINEVTRGGAFYVINGGLLALVGDEFNGVINADGVVNMYDNLATQGGAVYVSGQDSQVYAQGVLGHENVASVAVPESSSGGFAHVSDQATFNFIGRLDEGNINCWDPVKCSWLVDNQSLSGDNDQGGAITAEGGAQVTISGVRFEQNLSNVGQAISLVGLGTLLHLENSEVVRHGIDGFPGESTIHLTDGARMNSLHNTIVNNESSSSIIRATMGISFDTGFSDFSSIIYNQAAHDSDVYSGDMAGGVFDCLITHDPNIDASFNGQLLRTNVFDTAMLAFQDIENGLFDLTDQSLAIDYCDDSNISDLISISDIKGAVRGNDGPAIGLHGLYDVGAHAYQNTVPGISVINEGGLITSEPDVSDELQFFLDTSPVIDSAVILDLSVDNDRSCGHPHAIDFYLGKFPNTHRGHRDW